MITAIDPSSVKTTKTQSTPASQDFAVFMGALSPASGELTIQSGGTGQESAVARAAMTGLAGATAPYNAPYLSGSSYGSGGAGLGLATPPLFDPTISNPATGAATPAAATGGTATNGALPFQNPSQDFVEKDYLLRQMNDSAMNMLLLQAQVQEQNKNYTMVSNMLQSRDRTLHNMIQNIRGM